MPVDVKAAQSSGSDARPGERDKAPGFAAAAEPLVLLRATGMNTISAPEKAHLFNMLRRDYPKCAAHLAKFGV